MYPDLPRWRAVRNRLDPAGVLASDLDRRLDLTGRRAASDEPEDRMRDGVGRIGTVLVFGGTSDIGRATAAELLRDGGGTAILAGRRPAALEEAARRLAGPRRTILTVAYDAADPAGADRVLRQAGAAVGDLDVVLVCLGALGEQDRLDADPVATGQSLQINMLAPAVASHAAALRLAAQGHGVLVVLSSVAALRPRREILTYSAAKAGLDAYARGLAEWWPAPAPG